MDDRTEPQAQALTETAPSPPALTEAIDRLLAHPELLSLVASAIGAPDPAARSQQAWRPEDAEGPEEPTAREPAPERPPREEDTSAEVGKMLSALAPLLSRKGGSPPSDDPRACLLCALKPYVSPGRREAIDTLLRLTELSDLLRKHK